MAKKKVKKKATKKKSAKKRASNYNTDKLKIIGSLDDVLKVSIPTPKTKEK